jgi:hypothetical protein
MSSQPNSQDFRVPHGESQSLDIDAESQTYSQGFLERPKQGDYSFRCWKFRDFIQADVSKIAAD